MVLNKLTKWMILRTRCARGAIRRPSRVDFHALIEISRIDEALELIRSGGRCLYLVRASIQVGVLAAKLGQDPSSHAILISQLNIFDKLFLDHVFALSPLLFLVASGFSS